MEDIDVGMPASNGAMTRGDDDDDEDLEDDKQQGSSRSKKSVKPKGGGVTLSGLLNAIVSELSLDDHTAFLTKAFL